ncbi:MULTISPECIES: hypothetical protein [Streptomyces]|uniref:hypothetical protein n=1 Tax=Streptomyces TaxID=1883 RepID=UPI0016779EC2|nr:MULTISPECIES: hypothetical protein [Streptomyces]MBD3577190.1 hypothetical protein [Streptomyces sp. KD18]GGS86707.1 hypothetical protein GCM10010286_09220 [Streptomyces toxytricini]
MTRPEPLSRTFLLIDTERFSDRDDVQQGYLRRMLFGIVDRTLLAAGADHSLRRREDRGDAVMELIDPSVPLTDILRALLRDAPAEVRAVNRLAARSAQIRLRAVLAHGFVHIDEFDGWVGTDLNNACRLLDGEPLREALRDSRYDYALCVSPSVYSGVVAHEHVGIPKDEFHQVSVPTKNGPMEAWLYGPLRSAAAVPPPSAARPPSPESAPGGFEFRGTNHGVVAQHVQGGITFGPSGERP